MKLYPKTKPSLWDGLVVAGILALAVGVLVWLQPGEQGQIQVVISAQGEEIETISLPQSEEETHYAVQANGYHLDIVVCGSEVWVETADCPTQDCVGTGHISQSGQSIVCLPARVSIRMEGFTSDVDLVLG